jgi:hypothetical protein
MCDQDGQHRTVEASRELVQLDTRLAGALGLTHREHDLDEGREQARTLDRNNGMPPSPCLTLVCTCV